VSRLSTYLAALPALSLVVGLIVGPALLLIRVSLYQPATGAGFYIPGTASLENYRSLFDLHGLQIIGFTAGFGFVVAALVVALAFSLALFARSLPGRWQAVAIMLILIPKTAGLLATLFGLQRWLARGVFAAALAEVYLILPYAVLVLYVQLRAIPPDLIAAASGLGANGWQTFWRVTLPLSKRGLLVAFQMSALWGLGAFLGPLFLGGPQETTLSVELHRQAFEYGRWPRAAAEAVVLLLLLTMAVVVGRLPSRSVSAGANA